MKVFGYRSTFKGYSLSLLQDPSLSDVVRYCLVYPNWMLHRHSRSSKLLRGGIGIHNENHSQGEILYLIIAGASRPRPPPPPLSALAQPGFRSHPLPRSPSSIASEEPAPFPQPTETPLRPEPLPSRRTLQPSFVSHPTPHAPARSLPPTTPLSRAVTVLVRRRLGGTCLS